MSGFGASLKKIMQDRRISAAELSRAIEVPVKSVQEWTQKDRFPRDPMVIKKLGEYFKCTTHRLMFGSEDPLSNGLEFAIDKLELHSGIYEISVRRLQER